jgi:hypothetical protein
MRETSRACTNPGSEINRVSESTKTDERVPRSFSPMSNSKRHAKLTRRELICRVAWGAGRMMKEPEVENAVEVSPGETRWPSSPPPIEHTTSVFDQCAATAGHGITSHDAARQLEASELRGAC